MLTAQLILAALLLSAPAVQEPGLGGFDNPYRVRPASDGHFVMHADDLMPAVGAPMSGIVNLMGTANGVERYAEIPGAGIGIYRADVRMYTDPTPESVAELIRTGRNAGMQVFLTFVGTPLDLSRSPEQVEPPDFGMPGFAKTPPVDYELWAARVQDLLLQAESLYGLAPDYVEIWNEPDLDLWWTGTRQELLDLYAATAPKIRAAFPNGDVRIGGSGLGRMQAEMDGEGLVLEELLLRAAEEQIPLDFLSWHHYQLAKGMLYYDTIPALRRAMQDVDMQVDLLVSECGLYGRTEGNPRAEELDTSPAAAQYVGILASTAEMGLQACLYFSTQDTIGWDPNITDLSGDGLGVLTRRGVKKPVFRAMEFLVPMSQEERVAVDSPDREWAVTAFASRSGNRVRLLLANDTCEPEWIWAEGCKERGAAPRRLWNALQEVPGRPTVEALMAAGLEAWEAEVVLQVLPIALEAQVIYDLPRQVTVDVDHAGAVSVQRVVRFSEGHNDPASRRAEFLSTLEWVDVQADTSAAQQAAQVIVTAGYPEPPAGTAWAGRDAADLAAELGIPERVAEWAVSTYEKTFHNARLDHVDTVNSLPAAQLEEETASEAGVVLAGNTITVQVPSNGLVVLDLELQ